MRKTAGIIMSAAATAIFLTGIIASPATLAAGKAPNGEVCGNKANPPKDAVTQGGCLAIDQKKGNCLACHRIEGGTIPGNIAPPLIAMSQRFPDKAKLRAQVWDATVANPNTSMPPFGRHKILSEEEIDKVVEFLLTL
jgi:L-cysteine S-thiosulfotransferase